MSEAIIFENMPYNLFLKQRMEFVVICGDHLAANVMRVFEAEMIKRKEAWQVRVEKAIEAKKPLPKEPKTWWVQLSQSQIIARLYMYDSAKLKKPESEDMNSPEWVEYRFKKALSISKGTLRKAVELLKSLGFLLEKGKDGDEFGSPMYTLHKTNVQNALKALPANPFTIFHHLGGDTNFESGGEVQNLNVPPTNFESGEMQNLEVPGSKFGSPQVQNLEVDRDRDRDTLPDSEIDNEIESTYPQTESHSDDSGSTEPTHTHSLSANSQDWLAEEHAPTMAEQAGQFAGVTNYAGKVWPDGSVTPGEQGVPDAEQDARPPLQGEFCTSQGSSAHDSAKVEPKEKRARTPKPPKVSPEEIDLYRRVFDDCYREALDDESVGYAHTKASDKCLADLLEANLSRPKFVTPKKLHAVYVRLWNMPKDQKTGFSWREHMSIKAICNNYEAQALAATAEAHEKQQRQARTSDDVKREAIERAQSGELLGGLYRYVKPAQQPLAYMTAEQHHAVFGGK